MFPWSGNALNDATGAVPATAVIKSNAVSCRWLMNLMTLFIGLLFLLSVMSSVDEPPQVHFVQIVPGRGDHRWLLFSHGISPPSAFNMTIQKAQIRPLAVPLGRPMDPPTLGVDPMVDIESDSETTAIDGTC
jgi:hypothetical protein